MKKVLLSWLMMILLVGQSIGQSANLMAAGGTVNSVITSVGNVPLDRFKATNEIASLMVAAMPVQASTLSQDDKKFIATLSALSQQQLTMARLANGRNGREELNLLAAAMQEEQTIVLEKLKELMRAANLNASTATKGLNAQPTAQLSIPTVENFFLTDCGIENHEQLLSTLRQAAQQAQKTELRQLAEAIIPSVHMRLIICRDLKARYYPKVNIV